MEQRAQRPHPARARDPAQYLADRGDVEDVLVVGLLERPFELSRVTTLARSTSVLATVVHGIPSTSSMSVSLRAIGRWMRMPACWRHERSGTSTSIAPRSLIGQSLSAAADRRLSAAPDPPASTAAIH